MGLLVSLVLAGSIAHQPVPCVPVDRYARVAAEAPSAVRAELQFRTTANGPWYSAGMTRDGTQWVGFLPRPTSAGQLLEYRVLGTADDATSASTEVSAVRVVATPAECDAESSASVATPIVVAVPEGAPLVPPVPAGLSPAGVTAAAERPRSKTGLKIAGAAAAVAVGAATVFGLSQSEDPEPEEEGTGAFRLPDLRFDGAVPAPGGALSLAEGDVPLVFMVMDHEPSRVVPFVWLVEFLGAPGVCARMAGSILAQRPVGLAFQAPLLLTGACGTPFDVSDLRIVVTYQGVVAFVETVAWPFRVLP